MTANEHPNWSFKYLQGRFKQHLRHNSEIARFRKEILTGRILKDKINIIKKMFMTDLSKHEIKKS